ncbi:MAG TPA: FAD-binding oxidoreductase [Steroidobacteraceae bacterium]|jgi:gamma-glutamylputrescine oxidase|nr:FAD-binding oxidoreductase [Steroidobacteraceae bacterium]
MTGRPLARTSYFAAGDLGPTRAVLGGSHRCDVCVIGGGIAGTSTALHLAERGFDVIVLEAQQIGWGASGRSGAQVLPGIAASQSTLEKLIGADDARRVWDVSVAGVRLVRELIARHGIDAEFVAGHMLTAVKARHEVQLRAALEELQHRYDYDGIHYMPADEVRSVIASSRYRGALYDANAGHLQPLKYTLGLAAAAERLGVRIFTGSRAMDFAGRAPVRVRTAGGEVRCRQLVLCGNVYLGPTAPPLQARIMAVGTCIVATAPLGAKRAHALITNNAAVADMHWVLDYFRRSADGRLLFGGGVTYAGFDPDRIAAATRARMTRVFPQLRDVKIEFAWGGHVDITRNRAPDFGRLNPDVYYLQGFSGHGMALAGIAGKLVSEAIAGQAERFDVFARIPHRDFPGGAALRRPALVLAMLYYRIRDLL